MRTQPVLQLRLHLIFFFVFITGEASSEPERNSLTLSSHVVGIIFVSTRFKALEKLVIVCNCTRHSVNEDLFIVQNLCLPFILS